MKTDRIGTLIALAAVAACLGAAALLGLWQYMSATAPRLHPNVQEVPSVQREAPGPPLADAAERGRAVARAHLSTNNLPGLSVAVGLDGEIVWAEGFGWADLDTKAPVTPDTSFRIGTASMALTSAALGLLVERGRLGLDDAIQTHVPAFPSAPPPITVRQLMGHTAGVRNDGGDEGPLFTVRCARPADALPHFADLPLLSEPGSHFGLSSYGWILLSAAIESAAQAPFLQVMRKQVFEPLGMHDTRADEASAAAPDQATSYFPRFAADPGYGYHDMRPIDLSCYAGASAFLSTPTDLVRFGMAIDRGELVAPETVRLLTTSQRTADGQDTGYGLGWDLESVTLAGATTPVIGHDGDLLGGQVASLLMLRDRGLVVAVTSNISYADTFTAATRIAEAFLTRASASR